MNVGYRLYREIRDFAPQNWTAGELVVALMIADDASDITRQSFIANGELCYRARMKPAGVRDALGRLAARGFEFRVIHGWGKNGRPVYAAKGHRTDYLVPDMLKGAAVAAPNAPDGSSKGAAVASKGAAVTAPKGRKGAAVAAPPYLKDLNPPQIPSDDSPDLTPAVEGARARRQVNSGIDLPPVTLSQEDEFRRQSNGLREYAKNNPVQES